MACAGRRSAYVPPDGWWGAHTASPVCAERNGGCTGGHHPDRITQYGLTGQRPRRHREQRGIPSRRRRTRTTAAAAAGARAEAWRISSGGWKRIATLRVWRGSAPGARTHPGRTSPRLARSRRERRLRRCRWCRSRTRCRTPIGSRSQRPSKRSRRAGPRSPRRSGRRARNRRSGRVRGETPRDRRRGARASTCARPGPAGPGAG